MFRTIIVGTDGSEGAARAVREAADVAAAMEGAVLHIVSVQKPMATTALASAEAVVAAPVAAEIDWEGDARVRLDDLLARAGEEIRRRGIKVETHARFGAPAEVLCDMAAHLNADLIVVGNRGMQGSRRFLGSVPNTISHHAPCSVLIVETQSE
jgi:nucleotide-binding universal stress UspA family protein